MARSSSFPDKNFYLKETPNQQQLKTLLQEYQKFTACDFS